MAHPLEMRPLRYLRPEEDEPVRELYALCHPTWPAKPPGWYFAFPTLLIRDSRKIIASTSFSVCWPPMIDVAKATDLVMYGQDVCVHPDFRGRGLGLKLCERRLAIAREVKATLFIGMTWAGNAHMRAIFAKQGCVLHATIKGFYPPPDVDGLMYVKGLA